MRVFGAPRHDCQKNILGETLRQVPRLKWHLMGVKLLLLSWLQPNLELTGR